MNTKISRLKNIVLRKDIKDSIGQSPVCIRIKLNGLKVERALGVSCKFSDWDEKSRTVKRSDPNYLLSNRLIDVSFSKVSDLLFHNNLKGIATTKQDVLTVLSVEKPKDLLAFIRNEIEKDKRNGYRAPNTLKNYNKYLNKLAAFRDHLPFNDLSQVFLQQFRQHMEKQLHNRINTVNATERFLKSFVNRAIAAGYIDKSPFTGYKLKTEKTKTLYLTPDELTRLNTYFNTPGIPKPHRTVLLPYLFACYTGLRYSDVSALKHEHIKSNGITLVMKKTKQKVEIPINKPITLLLNAEYGNYFEREHVYFAKVFRVPVNQVTNRYLKEIAGACSIVKPLSFHSARHTFATLAISLKIDLPTVKNLVGHSSIRQTEHYVKILDESKTLEMQKFNIFGT